LTARIDLTEAAGAVSVRIAGRLDEPAARELLELCRRRPGRLTLDLEELVSLDRAAAEMLKDLRDAGARIEGATPYVRMLLNGGMWETLPATDLEREDE
jgi:anti-anti-sigma regulatory factor